MSIQIQTPNITAGSDSEKLVQIQSYLYRMANQLQWAFDTITVGGTPAMSSSVATQQQSAMKADPESTFAGIKDLIIKSADIVNAFCHTISKRLEGVYVAESDFGAYTEQTALDIQANSKNITQLYENQQELTGSVEQLQQTNAYLKTGLLDEKDGVPIYGLEIGETNNINGQNVYDKFARFTADRLGLYDSGGVEVAYISNYMLYITSATITGSLWLSGKFKIYYNGGLAFQWIGGES